MATTNGDDRAPIHSAAEPRRNAPTVDTNHRDASVSGAASTAVIDSVPTLALPKGGGAIRGIGEKVSVSPATGTASFSIPLPFSPGRGGAAPDLSLGYDSASGAGIFGWGWHLPVPAISYRTDRGLPRYHDDDTHKDTFVFAGGEDLVALLTAAGAPVTVPDDTFLIRCYAPRIEGGFARIERWVHRTTGDTHWRVRSSENVTTLFGTSALTRISDPDNSARVFVWLAAETFDDNGHRVVFEYKAEDRAGTDDAAPNEANRRDWVNPQRHLKRVFYGNVAPKGVAGDDRFLFELLLDYGEHPGTPPSRAETVAWTRRADPISTYRAGFELRTYRLCERVVMFHRFPDGSDANAEPIRAVAFDYERTAAASLITSVTGEAYAETSDGHTVVAQTPSLSFEYQRAPEELGSVPLTPDPEDLNELPDGFAGAGVHWVDIDGDGLSGALIERHDAWAFKANLSPLAVNADGVPKAHLGPLRLLDAVPAGELSSGGQFLDLEGDGLPDLVHFDGAAPGYSGRDTDGAWLPLRQFSLLPSVDWSSPDLHFLDLTGDGLPDVAIAGDDQLVWFPALGRDGYGSSRTHRWAIDEDHGPVQITRDADSTVFLADMSGDGLTDLVRIRAKEVAYWPNLGYGRFGRKVTMSSAPDLGAADTFDAGRVRLIDTDGSGTTDLVYLGIDGWSVHVNCAGNAFAAPRVWTSAPPLDGLGRVDAFDLLGNGTACLVWSTQLPIEKGSIRYVPLAGGLKPYLLTALHNGLGLETRIQYAPSTVFQLRDRMAGTPWATRLPFPVHLVERVETRDRVSGHRFVSQYAYHHGAYDGREREFRGFGFVEQWDSEQWSATPRPSAPNVNEASEVPPVRTRRWYHTGLPSSDGNMSPLYARDFFGGPGDPAAGAAARDLFARTSIGDVEMPGDLPAQDQRDACRALKGLLLRQEIYADDRSGVALLPYQISVAGYEVQIRQGAAADRPGVVFAHPRETLDVHLERDLASPRVAQAFVLKVGEFGDVLERAELSNGGAAPAFAGPGPAAITLPRAFVDETDVTNHIDEPDAWRTPRQAEVRHFALAGAALGAPWPLSRATMRGLVGDATVLTPTDVSDPRAAPCGKRLLACARALYRRDDLTSALQVRELQPRAIPYESYSLAFTPALLTRTFGTRIPAGVTVGEAGYIDLDGDGNLWSPSGRTYFQSTKDHPDDVATTPALRAARAAAEQSEAAAHFYLSRAFRDPFGGHSFVAYDPHDVFPLSVEDRAANIVTATFDTRTLQPRRIVDANGNRAFAGFDTLGRVSATAIAGKAGSPEGDGEPDQDALLAPVDFDALLLDLANPALQQTRAAALLGAASTRIVTDPRRFARTGQPTAAVTFSRETHVSELPPDTPSRIVIAVAYADGGGRIVQSKLLTEPGPIVVGGPVLPVRWITSGWTLFDNKGNAVRTYEPFHSDSPAYEPNRLAGVSTVFFRDPLSRVVGALHPDGTIVKTRFSPWFQKVWDANDTVLILDHAADPDIGTYVSRLDASDRPVAWHAQRSAGLMGEDARKAAVAAAAHADTPAEVYLDALGRTVLSVEDGGAVGKLVTTVLFDDDGSERQVLDARGRIVAQYESDLAGRRTLQASMEAGTRRTFAAADGAPLFGWDDRGHVGQHRYDGARRPTDAEVTDASGTHLRERIVYGESLGPSLNHCGRVHRVYDGAGLQTTVAYDFKGTAITVQRRFASDPHGRPDWPATPDVALEAETFTVRSRYDALGRPVQSMAPLSDRPGAPVSIVQCAYDESGKLDSVDLWLDVAAPPSGLLAPATATRRVVAGIDHDAHGRRTAIRYGNGTETTFAFDLASFRLTRVRTQRGAGFGDSAQDLAYTYDAVGNVTAIVDAAQQTIYFAGQVITGTARFTYDPLYRLTVAEGREHRGLAAHPSPSWNDAERQVDHPADANAMRAYTQAYSYDEVGNLTKMQHVAAGGNWTRDYTYLEVSLLEPATQLSNRLTKTEIGNDSENFTYDAHGNITKFNHLASLSWDDADRFAGADLGGGGRVDYQYSASGDRIRKVVERHGAGGIVTGFEERLYLAGFEIFRVKDRNGVVERERETLHVADGAKTVLHVESRTRGSAGADPAPARLFRYQFDNHLGSASLELDDTGAVISYEEYHPYGSTSLQSVRSRTETPKRYRYTGKERDEESGFTYHGARYYAPWIARWTACDPVGLVDGANLYGYVRANPIRLVDPTGHGAKATLKVVERQLWLVEARLLDVPSTATKRTRGFTAALRQHFKDKVAMWGGPKRWDISDRKPFVETPAGETRPVGVEERTANRTRGAAERASPNKVRQGKVDIAAPEGVVHVQPTPPSVGGIGNKPIVLGAETAAHGVKPGISAKALEVLNAAKTAEGPAAKLIRGAGVAKKFLGPVGIAVGVYFLNEKIAAASTQRPVATDTATKMEQSFDKATTAVDIGADAAALLPGNPGTIAAAAIMSADIATAGIHASGGDARIVATALATEHLAKRVGMTDVNAETAGATAAGVSGVVEGLAALAGVSMGPIGWASLGMRRALQK